MHQRSANDVVGENVSNLRGAMSQAELARRLASELGKDRIDPTSITRLESGKRPTTVNELSALGRIFDVSPETLLLESPFSAELAAVRADIKRCRRATSTLAESAGELRRLQRELRQTLQHLAQTEQVLPPAELDEAMTLAALEPERIIEEPPF